MSEYSNTLIASLVDCQHLVNGFCEPCKETIEKALNEAEERGRKMENEACARLAEKHGSDNIIAQHILNEIRDRRKEK